MQRIYFLMIAGAMMLFISSGCGMGNDHRNDPMENARTALAAQNYHRAEEIYRQVITAHPDSVEALSGLAETCIRLGDISGATDAYQRIINIDPDNVGARLGLARFDLLAGNMTSAEERIGGVLLDKPENTEALFLQADLYNRTSRFKQAIETFERILPLVSDKTEVLTGLARIQARSGDATAALRSLEQAVSLAPAALDPRLLLFNYYYGQGDYPNAEKTLKEAIAADPANATLNILLGQFYFNRKQTDAAEAAFLKAINLEPDQAGAYLVAGKFYSAVKKPEAALKMLQRAGRLRPQDLKISTLLAEFYLDNNYLQQAKAAIEDILNEHPGYFPGRLLEIKRVLAEKDYDQALLLCDAYLKSNPAADQLLVLKGMAYVEKGELEQAERLFSQAVKMTPNNINAKFRLLDVYLKEAKIEEAHKLSRDIFGNLHQNFDVAVILGDTELHKERTQKGLDSLDSLSRFASTNPFDRFRREHLENLRAEYARLMDGFNRILEKKPGLISIFENVILLHAARDEYDIALVKCDRQIERLKDEPYLVARIQNIKGGLYLAQHKIEQAEQAFKQAILLAPDFLKPYYGLAKVYIINKDIENAITQYRTLVGKDPRQPVPYLLLGVLHKMKMDFPGSEDYYRKALKIDPDFVPAANNLAYLLAERNEDLDEALSLALHAKQLKPDDPYILDTLGWIYFQKGLYEDAARELNRSADLLPTSATVNYHLGMAYYAMGDSLQAAHNLEKALQLDSDFGEADQIRTLLDKIY